jgi:hypothetical protein
VAPSRSAERAEARPTPRVGAALVAAVVVVLLVVAGVGGDRSGLVASGPDERGPAAGDASGGAVAPPSGAEGSRPGAGEGTTDDVPRADTFALSPTVDTGARPSCVSGDECLVWTVEQPGRGPVWRDVTVEGDLLVLTDRLGTTALDVGDGTTRWRIEADPTAETGARGHAVSGSLVVLVERDGVLRAYDRSTGALRWISPLTAALRVRHAVDHGDVVVVVADAVAGAAGAVRLVAGFDRRTGERRWLRRATSAASTTEGPVVFDGPGTLRGLDPADGRVRWEAEVDGPLGSVVGVGGSAVYIGWEQTVVVDAASGRTAMTTGPPPSLITARHAEAIVLLGDDRVELVTDVGSRWAVAPPTDACCATVLDGDVVVVDADGGRTVLAGGDGVAIERRDGRGGGAFVGPAWLVAADGNTLPGRQDDAAPEVVAIQVFDARGGRGVATTPPAIAIGGVDDGVVVAGRGWLSRIRTDRTAAASG